MRFGLLVLVLLAAASLGILATKGGRLSVDSGDTTQYLDAAYHLARHGTFTQADTAVPAPPALGREPGYPVLLALLMRADPQFGRFTPACARTETACDPRMFRDGGWANLALIVLAGITMFAVALRLCGNVWAAITAAAYLLLNQQMDKGWADPNSDRLAVWLVALLLLAVVWAWDAGSWRRWCCAGLVAAALTLTKAIFMLFAAAIGIVALATIAASPRRRRRVSAALAAAAAVYIALVGGWALRDLMVGGRFGLTDDRSGVVLSARAVFDEMTPTQYAAAFVYWTRGFGPGLARYLFAPATVRPFEENAPGGFYDLGQFGYSRRVTELMRTTGKTRTQADAAVDREVKNLILGHPLAHVLTTLPIFYRGIWIDEFIVLGLPCFGVAVWRAICRRDALRGLLLSAGVFNLAGYPLVSINIPRYQMTAVPAIGLAVALVLTALIEARWPQAALGRALQVKIDDIA